MSWPDSPLHDSLDIAYCSDFFGEIPNYCTNATRNPQGAVAPRWGPQIPSVDNSGLNQEHRFTSADAAMALGVVRAAGLIPQPGVEAFNKVRTSVLPSQRWPLTISKDADLYHSQDAAPPVAESGLQLATRGFHFTIGFDATHTHPPVASTESMSSSQVPLHAATFKEKFPIVNESSSAVDSKSPHASNRSKEDGSSPSRSYMAESVTSVKNGTELAMEATFQPTSQQRLLQSMLFQPKPCAPVGQLQETVEPSVTVSETADSKTATSDRSGEDVRVCGKRKAIETSSNTDRANEDSQNEAVDERKASAKRKGASRRNRAAEVHNLSERRRRDRINEKMRALQELIPNSSKTDKASMLDEAIEYLKTLQLQLQLMSMRSGLSVPSAIMSSGMQMQSLHELPQMHPLPRMAMGMCMGLGAGMGTGDMTTASPSQPKESVPPLLGPASYASSSALALTSVKPHQRLQGSNFMESLNPYSNCQQLQLPFQPVPMEAFNQNNLNQHVLVQSGLQQVRPMSHTWQQHERQPFLLRAQHMQLAETQHQLSESGSYGAKIP
ncbi:hypothetical protein O6H91_08G097300 [Diphasiastrum complanatum]|uniref:Uncharacterized protein n=1 Tax=Diphasiastrum complanatum TaxID=34168 RepID=A0ACC2D030_DIPCM|nr:hypothetical protein O6H91_08G097300 [Diphasiastrum complanatum]